MKKIETRNSKTLVAIILIILLSVNTSIVNGESRNNIEKPKTKILGMPRVEKLRVNEREVELKAYNIDGYNYLKLRDLASILRDTEKKFEVEWDQERLSIKLSRAMPYTGADIAFKIDGDMNEEKVYRSAAKVYIDGQESKIQGYRIKDNTYFKLRDLAEEINFGLEWNPIMGIQLVLSNAYTNKEQSNLSSLKEIGLLSYSDENMSSEYKKNSQEKAKSKDQEMRESMLELINEARKKEGLNPLTLENQLIEMAQYKAVDMKKSNKLSHSGSYGGLNDLLEKFNIQYSRAGENLLEGCSCEKEMFDLWWSSPGHKANMMNPTYKKIGIAFEEIELSNKFWAVQEFTD